MSNIYKGITTAIGNTPLVEITRINTGAAKILVKCEFCNPCGSVKDRIALAMIERGEQDGLINKDSVIIEPTSGNTGIGLAFVCASRGYKLILTMPESMSVERRKLLKMLGAQIVLTDSSKGMRGAIEKAQEIAGELNGSFIPQQFKNPANPEIHRKTTAVEIWDDADGDVDMFVAGVGTGGTLTGCGEYFKSQNPKTKIVAVEPSDSAVLSGGKPGPHKIQGIGAGFVPDILNTAIIDEVMQINAADAINCSKELAQKEGMLVGISAGANFHAAMQLAQRPENAGKTIVTVMCDTGERYISTDLFEQL
ncbi:MAG: cysteine synthase A [Sedimentisphaeraceae bacterium JB056]